MINYKDRINKAKEVLGAAEYILIGAGAGLSAAAGLTYDGERFHENFADFEEKYGIKDMYAASFYPFKTEEELWAQWTRHIKVNRYDMPPTELYQKILKLITNKSYFVITTNVESQFEKADFPSDKIFEVQGNYANLQCAKGCHNKLYYNEESIRKMDIGTHDCRIPSDLIPKCPVCGGKMDVNLRHNEYFVQDDNWYKTNNRYKEFLSEIEDKRVVFMEFGVGFNTPGIIRYPFEQMTFENQNAVLIRFNRDFPLGEKENETKRISFDEEISKVIDDLET
ncbi:MAG: SIR2 family NAD-dependent protein deacylase [Mobilitalea sp.]